MVLCNSVDEIPVLIRNVNGMFNFILLDGEYYLIGGYGVEGTITLPDSINGNPYHIKESAFV